MDTKLGQMQKENETLWREVAHMRNLHMKQQQVVNKLIQFLLSVVQPTGSTGKRIGDKRQLLAIESVDVGEAVPSTSKRARLNVSSRDSSESTVDSYILEEAGCDALELLNESEQGIAVGFSSGLGKQFTSGPIIADVTHEHEPRYKIAPAQRQTLTSSSDTSATPITGENVSLSQHVIGSAIDNNHGVPAEDFFIGSQPNRPTDLNVSCQSETPLLNDQNSLLSSVNAGSTINLITPGITASPGPLERNEFSDYLSAVDTDLDVLHDFFANENTGNLNFDLDSLSNLFDDDENEQKNQSAAVSQPAESTTITQSLQEGNGSKQVALYCPPPASAFLYSTPQSEQELTASGSLSKTDSGKKAEVQGTSLKLKTAPETEPHWAEYKDDQPLNTPLVSPLIYYDAEKNNSTKRNPLFVSPSLPSNCNQLKKKNGSRNT